MENSNQLKRTILLNKLKIYLTGGDNIGWALDEDLTLVRNSLNGVVDFTDIDQCDVVHSVWWESLLKIPREKLLGKKVVCQASGEPFRYMTLPSFQQALSTVGMWIAQSSQAKEQLSTIGAKNCLIPYSVDIGKFYPLAGSGADLHEMASKWGLPRDKYLIGNFHRDTEGHDLCSPKLVKGPDVFAAIVKLLYKRKMPVHAVLAGPRRHWLRRYFTDNNIPFTYIGDDIDGDDIQHNKLPHDELNTLYNLIDMYIVSSRSEGAPRSLLEAAASHCKVISTKVGVAEDVLDSECIYADVIDAADLVQADIEKNIFNNIADTHQKRVVSNNSPLETGRLLKEFYDNAGNLPALVCKSELPEDSSGRKPSKLKTYFLPRAKAEKNTLKVSLCHKFVKPPFGGGNQFMIALREGLTKYGVNIVENKINKKNHAYILNSIWFDVDTFRKLSESHDLRILHRIDGPISLIRGNGKELDDRCFELNKEMAKATVLQSAWTLRRSYELGYRPVNPVIILNSVDPRIFNPHGRISFDRGRKVRLVSSSWSDNPRKGGAIYKWIDENLDWDRFEYTFVGRSSESFKNIIQNEPVPSLELAKRLRQHDIYVTASQNDPCSNAVIEALSCGLPVLYLNDGGHPELVGFGGLPFDGIGDLLYQLDKLVDNYEVFQNLIRIPTLDEISEKYLELIKIITLDSAGRSKSI